MSDNKDTKKKGFFSRLIQGDSDLVSSDTAEDKSVEIPTKTQLNKMKKAEIVEVASNNGLNLDIFTGSTINTPSMICVEDFLDVLNWSKEIGGLEELIKRSKDNLNVHLFCMFDSFF